MRRSKLEKNKEAEDRAKSRAKRSHAEQLAILDSRLGQNIGATKERARLIDLMEKETEEKPKAKQKKKVTKE